MDGWSKTQEQPEPIPGRLHPRKLGTEYHRPEPNEAIDFWAWCWCIRLYVWVCDNPSQYGPVENKRRGFASHAGS